MKHDYVFGELRGHPVGTVYPNRKHAMWAGLHATSVPGISGTATAGADCIALNGGYPDDVDSGTTVLYTGVGKGAPQDLANPQNASLVYSEENGLPVRILRGPRGDDAYSPASGYRYDGLYKITDHWSEIGVENLPVWRFRMERLTPDEAAPWTPTGQTPATGPVADYTGDTESISLQLNDDGNVRVVAFTRPTLGLNSPNGQAAPAVNTTGAKPPKPTGTKSPSRATGVVQRIVRNNAVSQWVKELYDHRCQICRTRLDLPVGQYSEGAHIRAVGKPHEGPDTTENVLCLCPNHHVLFDKGGLYIDANLEVRDHTGTSLGVLLKESEHQLDMDCVAYHREHHGFGAKSAAQP